MKVKTTWQTKDKKQAFENLKWTKIEGLILEFIQEEMEKAEEKGIYTNIMNYTLDQFRFRLQKKEKELGIKTEDSGII